MKIILLRLDYRKFPVPPPYLPIGILYLASVLEKNGFEVKVIDLNIVPETSLWQEVRNTQVIGISMLSYVRSQGYRIINELNRLYPEKKIVLGGAFPASISNVLLARYPINAIVAGEGEQAFLQLCKRWQNNEVVERKIYSCNLMDINSIPFPAWHHSNFDYWTMQIAKTRPNWEINGVIIGKARWSPIIASRGCFGRCTFCNAFKHWNYKIRFRSGKSLVDEIEQLVIKHNVTLFSFDDDAFPINKQQCLDFCNEIKKRGLKIAWKADTRADRMDKEMLIQMKEAGCFMLAIGIESGSPIIIKNIKKNLDLNKAKQTIAEIKKVGIIAYALLMIGNPGENESTIKETVKFLEESKPNIYSYVTGVMIVPGTEMQQLAGISDEFYAEGDGLPYYTKEHSLKELTKYAQMIEQVPKNY